VKYIFVILLLISCSKVDNIKFDDTRLKAYADDFAYLVYDVNSDKVVASSNEDKALIPASLFKLFTNFAALEILGPDKKFETKLYINGNIEKGVLKGDLIISGSGDPTFYIENLYNFALALKAIGISEVKGDLLYFDNNFLSLSEINERQTNHALYNPSLSGLNLNFNSVRIDKNQGVYNLIPETESVFVKKTKKNYHLPFYKSNTWFLSRRNKVTTLPVKNSSQFFAATLKLVLNNYGITIGKVKKITKIPKKSSVIVKYESKPVKQIVKDGLVYSNNLYSEILLLHIARANNCKFSNLVEASECLQHWYDQNYPKMNLKFAKFYNGSGLNENIKVSAASILELLKVARSKKYDDDYFVTLLPLSDYSGTMKDRFEASPISVFAKTGSMDFISAIAGYYFNQNNNFIFVFISNNETLREGLHKKTVSSKLASKWRKEINEKHEEVLQLHLK